MYRTAAWRALRQSQLEAFPNCQSSGCKHPATVVDHRIRHGGSNSLFHDPSNLQSLCKRCHDRKTARYDGGFGRARVESIERVDDSGFGLV
jgi:5-methylcytosine-specific restriction protein A